MTKSNHNRKVTLNDAGCFLVPEFSATGGVSYRRTDRVEEIKGDRLTADFSTRKEVDHYELVSQSRALINRAYAVLDRHATPTPVGHFVDPEGELSVREEIAKLAAEAEAFNTRATEAGSERRCRVAVYAVALVVDDERAATRLSETVRDRLVDMIAALTECDRKAFDAVYEKSQRLDRLATGIQADAIRMALDAAKKARRDIVELGRDGLVKAEIRDRLDLSMIDSAIQLFTVPEGLDA